MTERLRVALQHVDDYLSLQDGVPHEHAASMKSARDSNEPGKARKERMESRLAAVVGKHFRKQRLALQRALETNPPAKAVKADATDAYGDALNDDDFEPNVYRVLLAASKDGVSLFQETATLQMDYALTNEGAAKWAAKHAGEMVKGIDKTTLGVIQGAVSDFVRVPGFTLDDLMQRLPFDEDRALRVSTTEITTAYSTANLIAGKDLQREFPDVKVTKQWFTNNDDRVCPICEPLGGEEVDIGESFSSGDDGPPGHISCRCWVSTQTRITND